MKPINKILLLAVIMSVFSNAYAQYDISFTGYAVDMPVYTFSPDKTPSFFPRENQLLNLTRLRLKPQILLELILNTKWMHCSQRI